VLVDRERTLLDLKEDAGRVGVLAFGDIRIVTVVAPRKSETSNWKSVGRPPGTSPGEFVAHVLQISMTVGRGGLWNAVVGEAPPQPAPEFEPEGFCSLSVPRKRRPPHASGPYPTGAATSVACQLPSSRPETNVTPFAGFSSPRFVAAGSPGQGATGAGKLSVTQRASITSPSYRSRRYVAPATAEAGVRPSSLLMVTLPQGASNETVSLSVSITKASGNLRVMLFVASQTAMFCRTSMWRAIV